MKFQVRLQLIFITYLSILGYVSCTKQEGNVERLFTTVEEIVEQQPDSALSLLNTILFPENLKESRYNKFLLLQIQAKDKADKDITSDTIIFTVKDYYVKRKDFPNATLATFYCGRVLHDQKKSEKAVDAYLEADALANHIENNNLKGLIQSNLSVVYREQFLKEEAIIRAKNAVRMYDKAQNYKNEIVSLRIIGDCFLLNNEIDSAFHHYNEGINLADYHKIPEEQANSRQNMGVVYWKTGAYPEAKKMFREALSFSIDSTEQARLYMNLSKIYNLENEVDSARFYITQSLNLQAQEPALLRSTYLLLSEIEENSGHYKESIQYYKKYNNYVIKVVNDNKNKALLELLKKYDFEKQKNENNKRVIKHQKTEITFFIAFIVTFVIAFFLCVKFFQSEKLRLESEQKIENMKKMSKNYSEEDKSARNILLQHFNILKKVALIETNIKDEDKNNGKKMVRKFNKIVYEQDSLDWEKLYQIINRLHSGLYDKVREKYPQLDDKEFRLCYLSGRNDFNDDEIAILMKIQSTNIVRKMRTNIRKKIGVPSHQNIHSFFIEIFLKEQ